ncbi:MAG: di-heme oxidoredictase family protein [Rhodospirillales bacterium]
MPTLRVGRGSFRVFQLSVASAALVAAAIATARGHEPHVCPPGVPDTPSFAGHLEHPDIVAGRIGLKQVLNHGKELFVAPLNICDGAGRPATTGTGAARSPEGQPAFLRTSGPDAAACAGCHNQPAIGGGGDFVANVFVLAQALDPVTFSVSPEFSNERNTLGMFGAGAIEMLGREMTAELQAQAAALPDGDHVLVTKGVSFEVTIAGGVVTASSGVDTDLVVKPFHQAGVVRSIREFTVNAFNHHHGMQAEERFDLMGKGSDFDDDGVERELTIGDITAVTLFQAALPVPVQEVPTDRRASLAVKQGEKLFEDVGCAACHMPTLRLDSRLFVEPNPLNPPGTFGDASQSVSFDMTRVSGLEKAERRGAIVRAYTDLKRHVMCDAPDHPDAIRHFCNETLDQGRPEIDGRPGRECFITRKLWDVGNSAPYGHRGDLTTIAEAILAHGGASRASRDAFVALGDDEQRKIVAFLKSLKADPRPPRRRND